MKAFHGDPRLKEKYLDIVSQRVHAREMMSLEQCLEHVRQRPEEFLLHPRHSLLVCTVGRGQHELFETELGIPSQLTRMQEGFADGTMQHDNDLPLRFLESVPVGADLQLVTKQYLEWLLSRVLVTVHKDYQKDAIARAQQVCGAKETVEEKRLQALEIVHQAYDSNEKEREENWFTARFALSTAQQSLAILGPEGSEDRWYTSITWSAEHAVGDHDYGCDYLTRSMNVAGGVAVRIAEIMVTLAGRAGVVIATVLGAVIAGPALLLAAGEEQRNGQFRSRAAKRQYQQFLEFVRAAGG